MGRSSRLLYFAWLVAVPSFPQVALAQNHRIMVRMPTTFAPPLAARAVPHMPPQGARPWQQRLPVLGALPQGVGQHEGAARHGRLARRNGFGIDGVGLGLSLADQTLIESGYGSGPEPQVIPALAPPPCVRPQIIKIGLGLRHPPRTRVFYGPPTGCVL